MNDRLIMIHPLRCALLPIVLSAALISASTHTVAQTLYKWLESDGSITFSADPPEQGIDYETVTSMEDSASKSVTATTQSANLPGIPPLKSDSDTAQADVSKTELAKTAKSKPVPLQDQPSGVKAPQADENAPSLGAAGSSQRTSPAITPNDSLILSRKQRQCEDLKKRVVSLERRMRSSLTPEDMDNTVVHMARYQRSYDQYCVQ